MRLGPHMLVYALLCAMRDGDNRKAQRALSRLAKKSLRHGPEFLTAVVEDLAPYFPGVGGEYSKAAAFASSLLLEGAAPESLFDVLPARAAEAMEGYVRFPGLWALASGGKPLPDGSNSAVLPAVIETVVEYQGGKDEGQAVTRLCCSWFDADEWMSAILTAMGSHEFRAGMLHRERVRTAAEAVADESECAHWLHGLTFVLDDEPLIVLDRGARRGYALTMSGIGDNYQLHTLLADRLIGDPAQGLLDGERPRPSWVAAATDGAQRVSRDDAIVRRFRMFDGHGEYVYPEGRPSDIEPLDGVRVLVLHPPNGSYAWDGGRAYAHMLPSLKVDRVMSAEEVAGWSSRVEPARESDVMARLEGAEAVEAEG